jgi:hypothetical protein
MIVRVFNCITYKSSVNFGYKVYVEGLLNLFTNDDTMFILPKGEEYVKKYIGQIGSNARVLFIGKTIFWTASLRFKLKKYNPTFVYHTMNYGLLVGDPKVVDVIIIHDLKWRHLGFHASFARRLQRYLFMKIAANLKNRFVAISDWTAYDYLCHTGKIIDGIIPNYVSLEISENSVNNKSNSRPYVLAVSANEKYKDLNYLEESFHLSRLNVSHQLFIVSRNYVKSNKATVVLSNLNNHEINNLVRNSDCIAIPSLFEGFGFPYYEGLIRGKKVFSFANPVALQIEKSNESFSTYNKVDRHLKDLFDEIIIKNSPNSDMSVPSKEMLLNMYLEFEFKCSS